MKHFAERLRVLEVVPGVVDLQWLSISCTLRDPGLLSYRQWM